MDHFWYARIGKAVRFIFDSGFRYGVHRFIRLLTLKPIIRQSRVMREVGANQHLHLAVEEVGLDRLVQAG